MMKFNTHFYRIKDLSVLFSIFLISLYTNANPDLDKLNVPNGFEIAIFADKLDTPRQLAETDEGYVIAGSKNGDKIYALLDQDLDGYAEKRILLADNLKNPTGVTVYGGDLYLSLIHI